MNVRLKAAKMVKANLFVVVVFLTATLSACGASLPTAKISIGTNSLNVEIASTPAERQKGLMFRNSMPQNHGMLFIFPKDEQLSFWMKNTKIPLSIAFIASDGTIKSLADMHVESLEAIPSDFSVRYALEVNQGYFAQHNIQVGQRVVLPADLPRALK